MLDSQLKNELRLFVILSLEGQATDQQSQALNDLLKSNQEAFDYYLELIEMHHALQSCDWRIEYERLYLLQSALEEFAVYEQIAPEIKIISEKVKDNHIQPVQSQKVVRKISKGSLFTLFVAAAAILLIFVFAYFAPPATGFKVAVLSDSIHAKWADMDGTMEKGTAIFTSREKLLLREGYAKLLFDNQAQVILEGPAAFEVHTEDQIKLWYGKIYAIVPREAIGFSVYTPNTKIIDMGTEFGVQSDFNSNTKLHVLKGKTVLMAGTADKVRMEVSEGTAKKISGDKGEISDIECRYDYFVRDINSKSNFVWKGQKQIDLADIVGGGNGFGTGQFNFGINPVTGEFGGRKTSNRPSKNDYKVTPQNPFVDGVFVPNGNNKQIISSLGHIFQECPVTQGIYFTEIINNPDIFDGQSMTLNGIHYGTDGNTCLFMHANLGITFDLDAIRSRLPGKRIVRFQSLIGVSDTALREFNADFWMLVDGKLRYRKEHVQQKGLPDTFQIELSNTDRFLTLVTTDGGDPDARILPNGFIRRSIDCDWCIFGSPVLILE